MLTLVSSPSIVAKVTDVLQPLKLGLQESKARRIVSNYRLLSSTIVLYFECRYDLQIVRVDVEKLKELRVERALSLRELGAASGLSHNTIWKLERGREEAHPRTIRKLAEALGVTPRDLMAKGDGDA